ncbi:MAG: archease [Armatimonadota bacterium]|nr:archease [Armatimonadota bacterium]
MNEHRFGYLEHTADKGVYAFGETLESAFESAAYGMFSLMADLERYEATGQCRVEVSGEDEVALLHAWLRELLFMFEVERLLPVDFHVRGIANGKLEADVDARPFGPDIEWLGSGVKAVTYHGMKVERIGPEYRVQAIVDV